MLRSYLLLAALVLVAHLPASNAANSTLAELDAVVVELSQALSNLTGRFEVLNGEVQQDHNEDDGLDDRIAVLEASTVSLSQWMQLNNTLTQLSAVVYQINDELQQDHDEDDNLEEQIDALNTSTAITMQELQRSVDDLNDRNTMSAGMVILIVLVVQVVLMVVGALVWKASQRKPTPRNGVELA